MPVNTLFFQNLRENEKIRKSVLHALIERIQAYPDRKVEVKFRIGKKIGGTGGGQNFAPPPVDILRTGLMPVNIYHSSRDYAQSSSNPF